jgi:hypothetical protein
MRYLLAILLVGCVHQRVALVGTVDIVEDAWCTVEIAEDGDGPTWVKLGGRQMKKVKEGDRVIFYVEITSDAN